MNMTISQPFPEALLPEAWGWLQQFPRANFDDFGPRSCEEFLVEMRRRRESGERSWAVRSEGRAVGLVGYAQLAPHSGTFHGVCFDRSVHGTGLTRAAIEAILEQVFAEGTRKVMAGYFSDNHRVHTFFKRLGAQSEGLLRAQTYRQGQPVDMRLVAFFAPLEGNNK
jgi:RimJ/RimL family protein N-acetyltransferase